MSNARVTNAVMEDNSRRFDETLRRLTMSDPVELLRLQTRNKELEKQLESLKENNIVQSMNDMKESYKILSKENVELGEKLSKLEESNLQKDLDIIKTRANIYSTIIKKMELKIQTMLSVSESVSTVLRSTSDDDGNIVISDMTLDGILLVMEAANESMEEYIRHEITYDLDCARGKCKACYRCYGSNEDVLDV